MNADDFNAHYPVGTPVFAYPGFRPEDASDARRLVTRTRTAAQVSASGHPVVWVEGEGSYICLTHVDPVSEEQFKEARAEETAAAVAALGALPVPLDDTRLAEIAERVEAATPGPWMPWAETYPHLVIQGPEGVHPYDAEGIISTNLAVNAGADAEFIAHAREDIPALLAEVKRLRSSRWDATKAVAGLEGRLLGMHAELTRARERVAELEAKRHSTNEALDDAVQALREMRDRLAEQTRYAAHLEAEICQCQPELESGEYMHEATCPVAEIQMRMLGCPGFEGNPVAPGLCAGCREPREDHDRPGMHHAIRTINPAEEAR